MAVMTEETVGETAAAVLEPVPELVPEVTRDQFVKDWTTAQRRAWAKGNLPDFYTKVLEDVLVWAQRRQSLCEAGANTARDRLGLPRPPTTHSGKITFKVTQRGVNEATATEYRKSLRRSIKNFMERTAIKPQWRSAELSKKTDTRYAVTATYQEDDKGQQIGEAEVSKLPTFVTEITFEVEKIPGRTTEMVVNYVKQYSYDWAFTGSGYDAATELVKHELTPDDGDTAPTHYEGRLTNQLDRYAE